MWVKWVKQYHGPKSRSGHVCQNIAWTRPWGLVLYKGCIRVKKKQLAHPQVAQLKLGPFGLESAIDRYLIRHECQATQQKPGNKCSLYILQPCPTGLLNELGLIYLHTVEWLQVLQFNICNFTYQEFLFYLNINHLFAHS